jgi:hypothetical protein
MANTDKKSWHTPKLRVFTRTRTQEMVLTNCKRSSNPPGTPSARSNQYGCSKTEGINICKSDCASLGTT